MKRLLFIFILSISTLYAEKITIAVAANVSYAIEDLISEFEKTHPDTEVVVTLGSSGVLTAQIKNRAPYGLFMSANMKYPQALYDENMAITKPIVYAQGCLSYFSSRQRDFSKGMNLLKDKSIKRVAIANPSTAPYGKAAFEALGKSGVYEAVKPKLIYAESISQTVSYAIVAAEIGLIAKSSLYSEKMKKYKKDVNYADVDPKLYTPIQQGMVLLKYGQENRSYREFYDFMLSEKAKEILNKYGYI